MKVLALWQNFYVIVGSSAGALIGLQFVALSLIANRPTTRVDPQTGATFATPDAKPLTGWLFHFLLPGRHSLPGRRYTKPCLA